MLVGATARAVAVVCLVGATVFSAGRAKAQVTVSWDCYVDGGSVDCQALESAFYQSLGCVVRAGPERADVRLQVRTAQLARGTKYVLAFDATTPDTPAFTLVEVVGRQIERDAALVRVLATLERGMVPYLGVSGPGTAHDGSLHLEVIAPDGSPMPAPPTSGFYLKPSLGASAVSLGIGLVQVSGGIELNYSDESWRAYLSPSASYKSLHARFGDEQLDGSFWASDGSMVLARSLSRTFSIAVLGYETIAPQNNLRLLLEAGVGLEWVRHAFLRTSGNNFGMRLRTFATHERYATPNLLGQSHAFYVRHSATVFYRLHASAADLTIELSAGLPTVRPDYWDLQQRVSVTWRVASGLELGLALSAAQRGGAMREPADPSALDPIAVLLNGTNFVHTTYQLEVSLSYVLGNSLLLAQDQRWR